jgi:hypothetical protein
MELFVYLSGCGKYRSILWTVQTLIQGCTNLPKTGDHLKILGSTNVRWNKFHTEQSQILDATAQNLNARETSRPRFVQPYVNDWVDDYSKLYKPSHTLGPRSWLFLKLLDETIQCYCGLTNGPAMATARRHVQTFWDKRRRNGLHQTAMPDLRHTISVQHTHLPNDIPSSNTNYTNILTDAKIVFTLLVSRSGYGRSM